MSERRSTVLVTGVGGNVGQGIVRILRLLDPELRIVGTNTVAPHAGAHACDRTHVVPPGRAADYVATIEALYRDESAALVIPSTDDETVALAERSSGRMNVAAIDGAVARRLTDKLAAAALFEELGLEFAPTMSAAAWDGSYADPVVKPRQGRGSRDVHIGVDPQDFNDRFVVQPRLAGDREVTSSFYIDRDGRVHATISLERELRHGATERCHVVHDTDRATAHIATTLAEKAGVRGSCNVQGIVDRDGTYRVFEVNARISGTASIRHHLGFRDVAWTIDEHLLDRRPAPAEVIDGCAIRFLADVIYPNGTLDDIALGASVPHLVF